MDDKSVLLDQLRIDRSQAPAPRRGRWWIWAAAIALLLVAAAAVWFFTRPDSIPVHVAAARALSADATGSAAGASVLDASGYVVARRQATVASKITARMVELDIEEGDHVAAGQVIAKLDDTNIRAALNAAQAQLDYAKASLNETQVNLANAQRDYDHPGGAAGAAGDATRQRRCGGARLEHRAAKSGRYHRARAVRGRGHGEGGAARGNGVTDIRGRRLYADRHRHHRGHGLPGNPGGRE
jgi:multidrug efflux pump subunit AcrA (membrane-fusion protein)